MADVSIWEDRQARAEFEASARARLAELLPTLQGQTGVIAIEPASGRFFVGATLGNANDAAFAAFADRWVYFARLDDPKAAIALPTW